MFWMSRHFLGLVIPCARTACNLLYLVTQSVLWADCRSVIDEIGDGAEEVDLGGRSVPMRAYASWFNFKGADQQKSVGVLSGGERNRLQLAKVICDLFAPVPFALSAPVPSLSSAAAAAAAAALASP